MPVLFPADFTYIYYSTLVNYWGGQGGGGPACGYVELHLAVVVRMVEGLGMQHTRTMRLVGEGSPLEEGRRKAHRGGTHHDAVEEKERWTR